MKETTKIIRVHQEIKKKKKEMPVFVYWKALFVKWNHWWLQRFPATDFSKQRVGENVASVKKGAEGSSGLWEWNFSCCLIQFPS